MGLILVLIQKNYTITFTLLNKQFIRFIRDFFKLLGKFLPETVSFKRKIANSNELAILK